MLAGEYYGWHPMMGNNNSVCPMVQVNGKSFSVKIKIRDRTEQKAKAFKWFVEKVATSDQSYKGSTVVNCKAYWLEIENQMTLGWKFGLFIMDNIDHRSLNRKHDWVFTILPPKYTAQHVKHCYRVNEILHLVLS